ncbi:hypothetical protein F2P81_025675 [Scophthalmus maximus]|uniref:Uncharacterized protein n=1 Tax=Scophthalmus maximus TaxID=52904 RepID=A0A6A4RST0_SCOMX|nr:hypothetical protein F2P81_025675 [Scophthalmus maximus]
METGQKAAKHSTAPRTESREVEYPVNCKSAAVMEEHKEKTLRENPEVLFTDYAHQKYRRKKNSLIFYTDSIHTWKDTLCKNDAYVSSEGIGSGGKLKICKDEHLDKDNPLLTITYYTKEKVMVQGNEANLESFEGAFSLSKAEVDTKKINFPTDKMMRAQNREPHHHVHLCPSHTCQLHQPAEGEYGPAGAGLC